MLKALAPGPTKIAYQDRNSAFHRRLHFMALQYHATHLIQVYVHGIEPGPWHIKKSPCGGISVECDRPG